MLFFALSAAAMAGGFPSVDSAERTGASHPDDAALVIGIEDYAFVADVPYASRDAQAFYEWAVYTHGVPMERSELLVGASREKILAAADRAAAAASGGTVWVYYAGHGAADPSTAERMLLGDDTRPDPEVFASRGVLVSELEHRVGAGGAQVVMLLDTCYTGAGRSGSALIPGGRFVVPAYATPSARSAIWTAAAADQISGPFEPVQHGAFTYFAIGALRGWADGAIDGQPDGTVTTSEAQAYVQRALQTVQVRSQTPALQYDGGELALVVDVRESAPDLEPPKAPKPKKEPEVARSEPEDAGTAGGESEFDLLVGQLREEAEQSNAAGSAQEVRDDWASVYSLAQIGGPTRERALTLFIDKYGALEPAPAEVAMATQWLEHPDTKAEIYRTLETYERSSRRSPSDQWGITFGGGLSNTGAGVGGGGAIDLFYLNLPFQSDRGPLLGFGGGLGITPVSNSEWGAGEHLIAGITTGLNGGSTRFLLGLDGGVTGLSSGAPRPVSQQYLQIQVFDRGDSRSDVDFTGGLKLTEQEVFDGTDPMAFITTFSLLAGWCTRCG